MSIVDAIYSYLPAKRKQTPSGWTKFNAVCCHHNGTSADTRQRGGIIRNAEGCSYHCFNCGYKASYVVGRHLTRKMRQFLQWLGASDDAVSKLALEALKLESDQQAQAAIALPDLVDKQLPEGSLPLSEWISADITAVEDQIRPVVEYVMERGFDPLNNDFYWSPTQGYAERVIIPFRYEGRTVGYTARRIDAGKPKYLSDQTPGYVFNLDRQCRRDQRFVFVVEGPMDALSIDGVAILGADIMDKQALLIQRMGLEPVVIPDKDTDGMRTIEQALARNWSVSLPQWPGCKDANDAVRKYGRLATIASIVRARETSELKVRLTAKRWLEG
jgi:hypothetical protein